MNSISPNHPGLSSFDALALNEGSPASISSSETRFQVEKSLEIEIATADGDAVTINSHYSLEASYLTYNSQGLVNGSRVQTDVEAFYLGEQVEFEMTIEGDLNKEEIRDIRKTLHLFEKIVKSVSRGRGDKAFERAEKIPKLESISYFEAASSYRQVDQAIAVMSPSLPSGEDQPVGASLSSVIDPPLQHTDPLDTPNDTTLPTAPATPEKATMTENPPEATVSPALESHEEGHFPKTNFLVKRMVEIIVESKVEVGKIGEQVNRFLDHLINKFEQKDPGDFQALKLATALKDQLSSLNKAHEVPEKSVTLGTDRQESPQLQTA